MESDDDGSVVEGNRYYWNITSWFRIIRETWAFREDQRSTSFELHGKKWWCTAVFTRCFLTMRIKSQDEGVSEGYLFEMEAGMVGDDRTVLAAINGVTFSDTHKLIRCSDLDSALRTNRDVYLFVEMRKKTENAHKIKNCRPKIEIDFTEMLLTGRYSDVTLEVQGQKFNCHRCIIGARSPVLAAMFEHDMKEKSSGVVSLGDAEPGVFQEFLLYLYSANDDQLSLDNAAELYKLGDKYGVEDLKNVCREKMQENMDKENFCEVFMLSQLYSDAELTEKAMQFFLRDPQEIMGGECWDTFLSENPVEGALLMKAVDEEAKK